MKKTVVLIVLSIAMAWVNAQEVYSVDKDNNKVVYGKAIKLFVGDTVFIETTVKRGIIKKFKVVPSVVDASRTLIIEFNYDFLGNDKASQLKVRNPYDKTLDYKAEIRSDSRGAYSETSIMPIYPRIFCLEMWPYKIESIILSDFKIE